MTCSHTRTIRTGYDGEDLTCIDCREVLAECPECGCHDQTLLEFGRNAGFAGEGVSWFKCNDCGWSATECGDYDGR